MFQLTLQCTYHPNMYHPLRKKNIFHFAMLLDGYVFFHLTALVGDLFCE